MTSLINMKISTMTMSVLLLFIISLAPLVWSISEFAALGISARPGGGGTAGTLPIGGQGAAQAGAPLTCGCDPEEPESKKSCCSTKDVEQE